MTSYKAPIAGIAAAGLLVGAFLLGISRSGSAPAAASTPTSGKITVTGSGTATGTPNQLVLTMGVQVNGPSVTSAVAQANRAAGRVIAALTSRGVPKKDIQTAGFSIQPNYGNGSQIPVGYGVSEQLTITLSPLTRAGTQIQAAVTAGGNATTVDGVSLDLTDTGALMRSARANAIADARARATQYAAALGEHITGVVSISEQAPAVPYPILYGAVPSANRAAHAVPIKPGTQQVSAQVTVVFGIA
jgi:uncharacterized protein YggE